MTCADGGRHSSADVHRQGVDPCLADSADPASAGCVSQGLHGSTHVSQAV
jgi:hypothetical protein